MGTGWPSSTEFWEYMEIYSHKNNFFYFIDIDKKIYKSDTNIRYFSIRNNS